MKRKELEKIYGFGRDKIRELVREAGITHSKELLPSEIEKFIKHVGKPIKPNFFDRV
jgi:hypothetical protein